LAARYLPLFSEQKTGIPDAIARTNPEVVTA
jgi:hypothetical protein